MDIRVPKLAEGVESATVVSISVSVGDQVDKNQTVMELESNKAVAAITADAAGKVAKIHVKEGDVVSIGTVLVTLEGGAGEAAPSQKKVESKPAEPKQAAAPVSISKPAAAIPLSQIPGQEVYQSKSGFPPPASPTVRKLALELGIDLSHVKGSEHGGRISVEDLRRYVQFLQAQALSPKTSSHQTAPAKVHAPSIDFSKWGPVERKKITPIRKTIAQAMTDSWNSVPRVTQFDDFVIDSINELRKKYAEEYEKKGARLTITPFIIKAVCTALKQFPVFNTSLDEAAGEIVYKNYYHIGIAVDTEHGLMVPVLRNADKKSFLELSLELQELADKAKKRTISAEEMQGGTFTISNQGAIGGKYFTPIINKPEVAILGVGRGYMAAVPSKTNIETKMLMPIGLSYDHRVVDGGQAARFVVALAEALQKFTDADLQLNSSKGSPVKSGKEANKK